MTPSDRLCRFGFATLLLASFSLLSSSLPGQVPRFVDIIRPSGIEFTHVSGRRHTKNYLFEAKGGGVAFLDYNNDGWLDVFLVQGSTLDRFRRKETTLPGLFRNRGDGTFEDVTAKARLSYVGWGMGVATGDYDNDGFVDIYVTCLTENVLFRNNGDGTFSDVTHRAGVGDTRWSSSAAFGDYDLDGYLDLFVCNYVSLDFGQLPEPGSGPLCNYRGRSTFCGPLGLEGASNSLFHNNGDGTFTDVTMISGVDVQNRYFSLAAVWADIDSDGDPDLYVANDSTPNQLFLNQGKGFTEIGFPSGLAANSDGGFQASMGIDIADFNNDGLLDVFSAHFANDYSTLYVNRGNLLFFDITTEAQLVQPEWLWVSWGARFVDIDHDGWKDLVHSNGHVYPFLLTAGWPEEYGQPLSVYLNQRDGTFRDVSRLCGPDVQRKTASRGVAFGDFDNDGDVDMLVTNLNDQPQFFRNDRQERNHWLMFRLKGTESNRDAIGARLTLQAGDLRQIWETKRSVGIYSSSDPRAHFGLGSNEKADLLRVRRPSGKIQEFQDLAVDRQYLLDETEGLSSAP